MAITRTDALKIAQEHLNKKCEGKSDDKYVVIEEKIVDKPYGWIFIFNSEKFIETGNILYSLGGNGPLVVEKESGKLHELGTVNDFEVTVNEFELDMGFTA